MLRTFKLKPILFGVRKYCFPIKILVKSNFPGTASKLWFLTHFKRSIIFNYALMSSKWSTIMMFDENCIFCANRTYNSFRRKKPDTSFIFRVSFFHYASELNSKLLEKLLSNEIRNHESQFSSFGESLMCYLHFKGSGCIFRIFIEYAYIPGLITWCEIFLHEYRAKEFKSYLVRVFLNFVYELIVNVFILIRESFSSHAKCVNNISK